MNRSIHFSLGLYCLSILEVFLWFAITIHAAPVDVHHLAINGYVQRETLNFRVIDPKDPMDGIELPSFEKWFFFQQEQELLHIFRETEERINSHTSLKNDQEEREIESQPDFFSQRIHEIPSVSTKEGENSSTLLAWFILFSLFFVDKNKLFVFLSMFIFVGECQASVSSTARQSWIQTHVRPQNPNELPKTSSSSSERMILISLCLGGIALFGLYSLLVVILVKRKRAIEEQKEVKVVLV